MSYKTMSDHKQASSIYHRAFCLLITFLCCVNLYAENVYEVIYGQDSRLDLYESFDAELNRLAKSSALLTDKTSIAYSANQSTASLLSRPLGPLKNLCKNERFYDQPVSGWCSGFLAAPDTLVTAGHCVTSQKECQNLAVIFDFSLDTAKDQNVTKVQKDKIYYCKSIVARQKNRKNGIDFAVIKLNRIVSDRTPLDINDGAAIRLNQKLAVIGNPLGLPTKIAVGGKVRKNSNRAFFETTLDTFSGNSGSAVLNFDTGKVEGILVRGDDDFEFNSKKSCYEAKVCKTSECQGEDVLRASMFLDYLDS